jgi:ABC-type multidrug transport system ATPase subunit
MADIEAVALTKRFGPITAVDALSFRAPAGKVTGFLGPNGSGKTTTLRTALGLVTPTEGRTVLVSSHLLSEVAQTADHVVIVAGGRLRFEGAIDALPGTGSLEDNFLRLTAAESR